jgi:hypothetical protein
LLKAVPAINEQLRKEGHEVEDIGGAESAAEPETADVKKIKKDKKKKSPKANIEATSDEDSE